MLIYFLFLTRAAFMKIAIILLLLFASPVAAQEEQEPPFTAENPLAALHDELKRVLVGANLPFTTEQENAVVLMVEERRRASEDLFGALMSFQSGPTGGQEADRLRSAIEWMRNEFNSRIQGYLTPEQLAVWSRFEASIGRSSSGAVEGARGRRPPAQTQYVRINNNAFTAEDLQYRFQGFGGHGFQGGGRQGVAAGVVVRVKRKSSSAAALARITATHSSCSKTTP